MFKCGSNRGDVRKLFPWW